MRMVQDLARSDPDVHAKLLPDDARHLSRSLIPLPRWASNDGVVSAAEGGDRSSSTGADSGAWGGSAQKWSGSLARRLRPGAADQARGTAPLVQQPQQQAIPYRAFLRSHAVRVLMFTHFSHNWCVYEATRSACLPACLLASSPPGQPCALLVRQARLPLLAWPCTWVGLLLLTLHARCTM